MPSYKKIHLELAEQFMDNTGGFFKSTKDVLKYAPKEAMEASVEINQISASNHHLKFDIAYKSFCSIVMSTLEQMSEEQKIDFVTNIVKIQSYNLESGTLLNSIKKTTLKYEHGLDANIFIKELEEHISNYKSSCHKEDLFINSIIKIILKDIKAKGFNDLLFGNVDYLSDIASTVELNMNGDCSSVESN